MDIIASICPECIYDLIIEYSNDIIVRGTYYFIHLGHPMVRIYLHNINSPCVFTRAINEGHIWRHPVDQTITYKNNNYTVHDQIFQHSNTTCPPITINNESIYLNYQLIKYAPQYCHTYLTHLDIVNYYIKYQKKYKLTVEYKYNYKPAYNRDDVCLILDTSL